MTLVIANNVSALTAQRNLTRSSNALTKSLERLASGYKINRGADGPAALVTSEKQRAQIAGLRTAIDNSEKAVSIVQTSEGALNEINSLLIKIRSLTLDSANTGVNDAHAMAANQAEIDNALDTITRIAAHTQFGAKRLLDGSAGKAGIASNSDVVTVLRVTDRSVAGVYTVNIQTAAERATVDASTDQTLALAQDEVLTINGASVTLNQGMSQNEVIARINEFTNQTGVAAVLNGTNTKFYTLQFGTGARLEVVSNVAAASDSSGVGTTALVRTGVNIVGTIGGNTAVGTGAVLTGTEGNSQGIKISLAAQTASANVHLSVDGLQGNVSVTDNSLVFQIGANRGQTVVLAIPDMQAHSLGVGVPNNHFAALSMIDVTSASRAQDAISVIDQAIDDVATIRGTLGAFQGTTLESTVNNLRFTLENSIAAESVIRDTDFAQEIANFTAAQILQQAGLSALGNANQLPQAVLALLRQ